MSGPKWTGPDWAARYDDVKHSGDPLWAIVFELGRIADALVGDTSIPTHLEDISEALNFPNGGLVDSLKKIAERM